MKGNRPPSTAGPAAVMPTLQRTSHTVCALCQKHRPPTHAGSGYLTACLGLLVSPGGRVLGVEAVCPLAERSRVALAQVVPGLVADGTVAVQAGNVLGGEASAVEGIRG